ncbi:MAG: zf-HC2 domain-containing protein [Candidatus Aminicenantes bacterium]|nr:zf-HC2 domain-containing protein [Candidatus Aminicenantes bacterium]
MKCPTPDLLEDYAEGFLSGTEARELEAHLGRCAACRQAFEARKRWLEACGSLPALMLPPGFAQRVMAAAFPRPRRRRRLLPALAAGLASLSLIAVLLIAAGVCNLPDLMTGSGRMLWRGLHVSASLGAKVVAGLMAMLKAAAQILRLVWGAIEILTAAAPPQVPVLALASLLVLAGIFVFGFRKSFIRR